jgi:hypothetical protein
VYQICDKLIHHFLGVVRSWCNPQLFLSPWHSGVVDGLNVVAVLDNQIVGNLGGDGRVTHLFEMNRQIKKKLVFIFRLVKLQHSASNTLSNIVALHLRVYSPLMQGRHNYVA